MGFIQSLQSATLSDDEGQESPDESSPDFKAQQKKRKKVQKKRKAKESKQSQKVDEEQYGEVKQAIRLTAKAYMEEEFRLDSDNAGSDHESPDAEPAPSDKDDVHSDRGSAKSDSGKASEKSRSGSDSDSDSPKKESKRKKKSLSKSGNASDQSNKEASPKSSKNAEDEVDELLDLSEAEKLKQELQSKEEQILEIQQEMADLQKYEDENYTEEVMLFELTQQYEERIGEILSKNVIGCNKIETLYGKVKKSREKIDQVLNDLLSYHQEFETIQVAKK